MNGHDYHPSLPGYHDGQLFVDGCQECEGRIKRGPMYALTTQDPARIRLAWRRMHAYHKGDLPTASQLERLVYVELEQVAIWLDKIKVLIYGASLPQGMAELVQDALEAGDA